MTRSRQAALPHLTNGRLARKMGLMPTFLATLCNPHPTLARFWLVCVLCLCAWRGPIPVAHCHAEVISPQLMEHLLKHHGGDATAIESLREWHWHFVMPHPTDRHEGETNDAGNMPVLCDPVLPTALEASVSSDADDGGSGGLLYSVMAAMVEANRLGQVPQLIPLAPPRAPSKRLSPQIVFCVARC